MLCFVIESIWGLTEELPLGPKSESAPPRTSSSSDSRAGEARRVKTILQTYDQTGMPLRLAQAYILDTPVV